MTRARYSREALAITAIAAFAVYSVALLSPAIFNDGDTYWHICAGQWMLVHHAVLSHDPFSLAFAGRAWETQEWLAEVAMAAMFQYFGWSGVAVLTGLAMAASATILSLYVAKHLDAIASLIVVVLGLSCVMPDYLARPHILALPFLTVWIVGLASASAARQSPNWLLLPIMAIWANLHGSFIFGIALIFPFGLETTLAEQSSRLDTARKWGLFAVAATVATLCNPQGLSGLLFPFHLMQLKSLASIDEWQSPSFHAVNPVEIAVLTTVFFFIWRGARISAVRLVLLLALTHLWLEHARYGMLLGIAGAIVLVQPLSITLQSSPGAERPSRYQRLVFAGGGVLLVMFAALRILFPIALREGPSSPTTAVAAVPASLAAMPVFNNYAFGGLLIFDGIKPLVDSRADFYGDTYLGEYSRAINADKATVDALFTKYNVAWTILEPGDPLVAAMNRRPGWHRLYADQYAIIHVGPAARAMTQRPAMQARRSSGDVAAAY